MTMKMIVTMTNILAHQGHIGKVSANDQCVTNLTSRGSCNIRNYGNDNDDDNDDDYNKHRLRQMSQRKL